MTRKIETIWILTNGNRGNEVICEGVAAHLGGAIQSFTIDRTLWTQITAPYWPAQLTARWDARWQPPWPDLVLASSRLAYAPACHIRAASGGVSFCVALQDPVMSPDRFDLVWAPFHDGLSGPNVISTLLSPHGITPERIRAEADKWRHLRPKNQPCIGVLIGGPNPVYGYGSAECDALITQLQSLCDQGYHLIITKSRRTPARLAQALVDQLTQATHIAPAQDNPYPGLLGLVNAIIVTPDSVNMTGEACAAGRPVYRVNFTPKRASKFDRFHSQITAEGLVLPLTGTIDTNPRPPRDDTAEIARAIETAFCAKTGSTHP